MKLYLSVYKKIIHKYINNFEYSLLPTQDELASEFFVSRTTILRALDHLEENDYIVRNKGSRSEIIRDSFPINTDKIYSFDMDLLDYNIEVKNEVLSINTVYNKEFEEEAYLVVRKKLVDSTALLFQHNYLLKSRFNDLEKLELNDKRLYVILKDSYDVNITTDFEEIKLCKLPKEFRSESLPTHCIKIKRYSYEGENLVEITDSFIVSDLIELSITNNITGVNK